MRQKGKAKKLPLRSKVFWQNRRQSRNFTALGQFINYRAALNEKAPDRILYLAVPLITYAEFFQLDFPKARIEENQVKMIVYDTAVEVIVEWKN